MGLIDFVKEAGQKLGLGGGEPEEKKKQAEGGAVATVDQDKIDRRRAAALVDLLEKMELEIEDLSVRVDGDVAALSGKARSQAEREKAVLVVGNTAGIARVDDGLTVAEPEPEATYYTVVAGDTLSKIAKEQYGNAMEYNRIFDANRPMLSDPNKIYPGQVLRIPSKE